MLTLDHPPSCPHNSGAASGLRIAPQALRGANHYHATTTAETTTTTLMPLQQLSSTAGAPAATSPPELNTTTTTSSTTSSSCSNSNSADGCSSPHASGCQHGNALLACGDQNAFTLTTTLVPNTPRRGDTPPGNPFCEPLMVSQHLSICAFLVLLVGTSYSQVFLISKQCLICQGVTELPALRVLK